MLRAHRGLPKVDANIIQYTFISLVGFFITISSSILYSSANKVKRTMDAESQAAGQQAQKDSNASLSVSGKNLHSIELRILCIQRPGRSQN